MDTTDRDLIGVGLPHAGRAVQVSEETVQVRLSARRIMTYVVADYLVFADAHARLAAAIRARQPAPDDSPADPAPPDAGAARPAPAVADAANTEAAQGGGGA